VPPLLRNIASTYGVRLAGIAAGVFLFPFVVAHVGLSEYGLWLLVSSVTGFFALDFGMGVSTLRYVAEARARDDEDGLGRLMSTSLVFFVALGGLAGLAYGLFMYAAWGGLNIPPDDAGLAVRLAVLTGLSAFGVGIPLGLFRTVLAGLRRYDLANGLVVAQILARTAATVVLLSLGFGILAVAVAELAVTLAGGVAAAAVCRRLLPGVVFSWRGFDAALLRSMAPYSAQVFLMTASGLVIMQADNVVIGLFLPVASVTLYAAAFRLYQTCRNLMNALLGPLVPEAAHAGTLGEEGRLRALLVRGTTYANGVSLLIGVPTVLFAEPVLVAWAGPEFAEVAVVAQILVVGLLVNNNHVVAATLLTGMGRVRAILRYHLIWAAANLVLSLLLIGPLGLAGVALGTTIPVVLLEAFYIRTAAREFGVPLGRFLVVATLRPFALAAVALIPVAVVGSAAGRFGLLDAVGLSGAFGLLYLVLFVVWGADPADRAAGARLFVRAQGGLLRGRA
jgi:O-antigen/teichoic acid export membrane protein